MKALKPILIMAAWTLAALPLGAQIGSTADEREQNRRRLERLKDEPEAMARIRKKAIYFLTLPEERRAKLTDLDKKLHQEPRASSKRLEKVMERYAAWLEGLDPAQRQRIKDASDSKTRLEIIKKVRAEEWLKKQPEAVQKKLARLEDDKRAEKIQTLRDQERKRKVLWLISSQFLAELNESQPMPSRLSDFGEKITSFFNEYLLPRLDAKEKERLKNAGGKWPLYPMTLVALADLHPPALPDANWPKKFDDLPREVKKRIARFKGDGVPKAFLQLSKQKGLAKAVSIWTSKKGPPLPHELFAHNLSCISEPVKQFVNKQLLPELTREELVQWNTAEGWPKFPLTLKQLAEDHDLQVPWHTLPGNPELWDKYRLQKRLPR